MLDEVLLSISLRSKSNCFTILLLCPVVSMERLKMKGVGSNTRYVFFRMLSSSSAYVLKASEVDLSMFL